MNIVGIRLDTIFMVRLLLTTLWLKYLLKLTKLKQQYRSQNQFSLKKLLCLFIKRVLNVYKNINAIYHLLQLP